MNRVGVETCGNEVVTLRNLPPVALLSSRIEFPHPVEGDACLSGAYLSPANKRGWDTFSENMLSWSRHGIRG